MKTIRGVLYTDLMKVLQNKKIEAVVRQPQKHHFLVTIIFVILVYQCIFGYIQIASVTIILQKS